MNLERYKDELHPRITVYNTNDYSVSSKLEFDENTFIGKIEYDFNTNEYYVLVFYRNDFGIYNKTFVGKYQNNEIVDCVKISEKEYDFYDMYLGAKQMGFTDKCLEWTPIDLTNVNHENCSLAKLYSYYNK